MAKHTAPAPIWYPNQRVIRSTIQAIVGAVPTVVAIIGIIAAQWPSEWLVVTLGVGVAIQAVLTKIMALPGVNDWLTGIGAGTVPRDAG